MGTTVAPKDEVLKKLISRASDGLVLEVYARIEADRTRWRVPWGTRPGAVKSWTELMDAAVREGTLTPAEAILLFGETGL